MRYFRPTVEEDTVADQMYRRLPYKSWATYLAFMAKTGSYGGEAEVQAFAFDWGWPVEVFYLEQDLRFPQTVLLKLPQTVLLKFPRTAIRKFPRTVLR